MELKTQEYEALLARLARVEQQAAKSAARNEVMNVAMKYFHYHQCFRDDLVLEECIAKKAQGVHAEHGASGVYEGYESVAKWWEKRPNPPGKMILHAITTPIVEVAEDLQTAKAVFILMGVECGLTKPGLLPEAMLSTKKSVDGRDIWEHWGFAKYGMDFISEDGEWKIWHFHAYDFFRATFEKGWVTLAQELAEMAKGMPTDAQDAPNKIMYFTEDEAFFTPPPDRASTFRFDYDGSSTQLPLFPPIPKPYHSFDETFEY